MYEKRMSELRTQIKAKELELFTLVEKQNKLDREERAKKREEREQRQWLNEFTARQAAYHRR